MDSKYFYHSQAKWIEDDPPLKIMEKSLETITFIGDTDDSHCDRFWAKALRQDGARFRHEVGAKAGW